MASRVAAAFGVPLSLAISACGGGAEAPEPTLATLEARAVTFMQAAGNGDIEESYAILHDSFKERCSLEQWRNVAYPLVEWPTAEYRVLSVDVQGSRAEVNGDYFVGETALGFALEQGEDDPGYWILDEGQWWATTDLDDPCTLESEEARS